MNQAEQAAFDAMREALSEVLVAVREYLPPDGISAKDCLNKIIAVVDPFPYGKPLIALTDIEISLISHAEEPEDWNDIRYRDVWHKAFKAGARAAEQEHGIKGSDL